MKVFILLSVFAVALAQECDKNQHYESCGTACPLTCKNYNDPPKACILLCNPGCHCDEGYVKTDDGKCVRPEQCSAQQAVCGENERYNECGTACPLTCDNYANPPKACVLMCKIGCECEKGYVRSSEGRCVRPEQCPSRTSSACDLPAERGLCMAYMPRFHFDRTSGECKRFIYGGCGGNENNFKTLEECKQACGTQSSVGVCSLRAEVGECRGYFPRFYYDEETQKCQRFIYGGCGGNENNFRTLDECHRTCGAQASVGVCSLEAEPGVCRAYIPRYFYNEKTGKCERFIYGGCGGNGNNFATLDDCHNTCA